MRPKNVLRIAVRKFEPFERAMEKLWNRYQQESGCTLEVELVAMDLDDLYRTTLLEKGLGNGDWDIAHMNTDWLFEANSNEILEDIQPYINQNPPDNFPLGWSSSLLELQQFENKTLGLPFHDGPECLVFRKDLFEDEREQRAFFNQYNKPLAPPNTWEEFLTVARFFQRPEENLYGAVFAGFPDGHNAVFDFCLQLWTRGGDLYDESGKININTSQAVDALDYYRQVLNNKEILHPQSADYDSVQAGLAFSRGEAALMINWFGFAAMCDVDEKSNVKGKVDITNIPHAHGHQSASLNVYWLYTIGAGSKHKEIAYDFIRFAINSQNDKNLTLEGGIGCRISTWNDEEINHKIPYYYKLEKLHDVAKTLPRKSNWPHIVQIIDKAVQVAINTDKQTQAILIDAQAKIEEIDESEKA
jgi:multiple sugar transport system substrate-binding protein